MRFFMHYTVRKLLYSHNSKGKGRKYLLTTFGGCWLSLLHKKVNGKLDNMLIDTLACKMVICI